jgi:hypothetical protein
MQHLRQRRVVWKGVRDHPTVAREDGRGGIAADLLDQGRPGERRRRVSSTPPAGVV